MAKIKDSHLEEIPSEFIEPYLAKFMGSMVSFLSSAYLTEEDRKVNNAANYHWTVDDVKKWVKGVELFVSITCGIHARYAMMNEMHKMVEMDNKKLKELCMKIERGQFENHE